MVRPRPVGAARPASARGVLIALSLCASLAFPAACHRAHARRRRSADLSPAAQENPVHAGRLETSLVIAPAKNHRERADVGAAATGLRARLATRLLSDGSGAREATCDIESSMLVGGMQMHFTAAEYLKPILLQRGCATEVRIPGVGYGVGECCEAAVLLLDKVGAPSST